MTPGGDPLGGGTLREEDRAGAREWPEVTPSGVTGRSSRDLVTPPSHHRTIAWGGAAGGGEEVIEEEGEDDVFLTELPTDGSVSMNDLVEALKNAQIRIRQLSRAHRRPSMRTSTSSRFTEGGEESHKARAKLQRPNIFDGRYSEEWCLLNWCAELLRYMEQCGVRDVDIPDYARTYMSKLVQAWVDATFFRQRPTWTQLEVSMKERYLPPDHSLRVQLKFEKTMQVSSLQDYVERFQVMVAALTFAEVAMDQERMILQFIRGLKFLEDRRFLLEKGPKTLPELYRGCVVLNQARTLSQGKLLTDSPKHQNRFQKKKSDSNEQRKFMRLTGEARQKAWEQGRCLGCGSDKHLMKNCDEAKKKGTKKKFAQAKEKGKGKGRGYSPSPRKKQFKKHKGRKDEEEDDEESEDPEESSGNSDPESEG